jgi:bacterioferritin
MMNLLLSQELTAIVQYEVHAAMCDHWGYKELHAYIFERAHTEMRHADMLIDRILFLEGVPVVSKLNTITIGPDVTKMLQADQTAEVEAGRTYNVAIALSAEVGDGATRTMLESIVKDESDHLAKIEENLAQIAQMGLSNYLSTKN